MRTLDDIFDESIGPPGSKARTKFDADVARMMRRENRAYRAVGWMKHIPIAGRVCVTFWGGILSDGIRQTCRPRWGSLTFAFLNDGFKPTVWHTFRQMTHGQLDRYTGIYPSGAPRSLRQAEEWEREWQR